MNGATGLRKRAPLFSPRDMRRFSSFPLVLLLIATSAPAPAIVGPARDGAEWERQVVMVLARQGGRQSVCSGVALGARIVLTAAHCLAAPGDTLVAMRRDGRPVPVTVARIARHPGYDPRATEARRRSIDVGLIETAAPLEGVRAAETADAPPLGAPLIVAGFGVTSETGGPSDGRLRVADLAVTAPLSTVTLWAGDPRAGGQGACHGDSGGPMFDAEGRVVAIVAWTNGRNGRGCGAITQGPLVGPVKNWIASTISDWNR